MFKVLKVSYFIFELNSNDTSGKGIIIMKITQLEMHFFLMS